jgi:hypothetical protein
LFLPWAKIVDLTLIAELRCPWLVGLHHRFVDPDGEQHQPVPAPFLGKCVLTSSFTQSLAMAFF